MLLREQTTVAQRLPRGTAAAMSALIVAVHAVLAVVAAATVASFYHAEKYSASLCRPPASESPPTWYRSSASVGATCVPVDADQEEPQPLQELVASFIFPQNTEKNVRFKLCNGIIICMVQICVLQINRLIEDSFIEHFTLRSFPCTLCIRKCMLSNPICETHAVIIRPKEWFKMLNFIHVNLSLKEQFLI